MANITINEYIERQHPLQMTKAARKSRKAAIANRMKDIEAELRAKIADPNDGNVHPALECEWALLDTESRQIEAMEV